ncbi:MAG: prolyl oligopeptidase family serine peptidase [Bacteroidota bacterium]
MNRFSLLLFLMLPLSLWAQSGKALQHSDYNHWNAISSAQLSLDGTWASFAINPAKGDGTLHLKRPDNTDAQQFERGDKAAFAPDASFLAFQIKAHYDSLRQAKLKKVKKDKQPKDSLGVWVIETSTMHKIGRVNSFQVPKKEGSWIAYQLEKPLKPAKAEKDTTEQKEAKKKPKDTNKSKLGPLVLWHPVSDSSLEIGKVEKYQVDPYGQWIGWTVAFGDSIDSTRIQLFETATSNIRTIYEGPGFSKSMQVDGRRDQAAVLYSSDTAKVKTYVLWHWKKGQEGPTEIVAGSTDGMPTGWTVSEHGKLQYSEDGTSLFFGTNLAPEPEPEDTLTDEEKYSVDVWNWQDSRLQPQQLKQKKRDETFSYRAVWLLEEEKMVQLATETIPNVSPLEKGDSDWLSAFSQLPYEKLYSWEWPSFRDLYRINKRTGKAEMVLEGAQYSNRLSPTGKYAFWYNKDDQAWYSKDIASGETHNLTGKLKVSFAREDHDTPMEAYPYRVAGWAEGDEFVLIQDKYDLWKIDPSGSAKAINLSKGFGRKNEILLSYQKLDRESLFLEPGSILLKGLDDETKRESYYRLQLDKKNEPELLMASDHHFSGLFKAEHADQLLWRKQSFTEYANFWSSDLDFSNPLQISDGNPQQTDFQWGSVSLVHWTSYSGKELAGRLYVPDNLDQSKKYPMLIYFYEKSSDQLHSYYTPSPSRSTIRASYCVSNDYVVFMPDIVYETGQPGEDAMDAVMSGTDHVLANYSFIDSTRMGLQGQSWGGYQVAYMVTKTDRYAAAMAGAPVSNMTSAYGGIRWGSGYSRMFQYEETQSRIGTTLWEDRERYINNSPVFFAPQVETPLLMMHNDTDGAVPWYQGIEMFVAMRRLSKPAWLLVYNKEQHNLTKWPNRMDLSIRMHQFFDHYLKDDPMPVWMKDGLPAVDKGKKTGYELVEPEEVGDGK